VARCCRKVQIETNKIITFCDLRSQGVALPGVWRMLSVVSNCPLRIACMTSMPALVHRAAHNDLNPSVGRVSRVTARWSCSTILFRYFE
jgi:hypothetical protein